MRCGAFGPFRCDVNEFDETSLDATGVPSEFLMMQPTERLQLEAELRMEIADWGGAEDFGEVRGKGRSRAGADG